MPGSVEERLARLERKNSAPGWVSVFIAISLLAVWCFLLAEIADVRAALEHPSSTAPHKWRTEDFHTQECWARLDEPCECKQQRGAAVEHQQEQTK